MPAEAANKRTSQRYDLRVDVEYTIAGAKREATSRNVSLGGLFVDSPDRLILGERLTVRFRVPTQKDAIEVGAVVRWTDSLGFGVQFDGLRARDVWALGKYFEHKQPLAQP